jgi:hypothetical protein
MIAMYSEEARKNIERTEAQEKYENQISSMIEQTNELTRKMEAQEQAGLRLAMQSDPIAKFADNIKSLRAALESQLITMEQFKTASKAERESAVTDLMKGFETRNLDIVPALVQGTREAYEALARNQNNQELQEAKKTNQKLEEIKRKLDFAEASL